MIVRIGTRTSKLALKQAQQVAKLLEKYHNVKTDIIGIKTTGDKLQSANLSTIGGKGLFLKEIEEQLLVETIDIAVHSLKDVPLNTQESLEINCYLKRANPFDAFVSNNYKDLSQMPLNSIIGTSATRRTVYLKTLRPDLNIVPFRGNVNTRLAKLDNGEVDACVLAVAGLKRIGYGNRIKHVFTSDEMIPAIGQGVICVQHKASNFAIKNLLRSLNHHQTEICISIERAFMANLSGSCTTPMAAFARIANAKIRLDAMFYDELKGIMLFANESCLIDNYQTLAINCSKKIKEQLA